MPLRRTIGVSLAFLMISSGAIGKTPDKAASHRHHPAGAKAGGKAGESEIRTARIRSWCGDSRYTRHSARSRNRSARPADDNVDGDGDFATLQAIGRKQIGKAAWYSLVGGYTSSGERLDTVTATAAHRSLPLASYAKVTSLDSGLSVVVKINDRGPQSRRFIIDLSPRAADEIDMKRTGVAAVVVEPVSFGPALANQAAANVAALQSSELQLAQ
jgi:rare lipoprotein A (peptidoglycan hydrolase)